MYLPSAENVTEKIASIAWSALAAAMREPSGENVTDQTALVGVFQGALSRDMECSVFQTLTVPSHEQDRMRVPSGENKAEETQF
ncbi:hypothetical protein BN14_12377 [Rhizoctonia solani AG-1 IB]|uniref:Uncharacterized protein n=1 Tax=Thanatephorus cucumeris (strain AG1-IB / isolate 7/3/14) TaxID=1108050 RepID=M5CFR5_THACB|nr:hypothetical protein BN14_12377 [Rhizoctonia solani AG-1 IB]